MKVLTKEQIAEHNRVTIRGCIEGAVVGTTVSGLGALYLRRASPAFRALPLHLKSMIGIFVVAPAIAIQAERRGIEYDRSQWAEWDEEGTQMIDNKKTAEQLKWEGLSLKEKALVYFDNHQYSLIVGGWALSMAVAGLIVSRDKYQTGPQKIVQVRMWAQGLTIGLLIAGGALAQSRKRDAVAVVDHSWMDVVEQQEREKRELATRMRAIPTPAA